MTAVTAARIVQNDSSSWQGFHQLDYILRSRDHHFKFFDVVSDDSQNVKTIIHIHVVFNIVKRSFFVLSNGASVFKAITKFCSQSMSSHASRLHFTCTYIIFILMSSFILTDNLVKCVDERLSTDAEFSRSYSNITTESSPSLGTGFILEDFMSQHIFYNSKKRAVLDKC